jgi:coenzyme F420-0:L-glutamate ligase/coenzyme F420-1:gamma-L-glutamate ligase
MSVTITGLETIPEVRQGDDVAVLIADAARRESQQIGRETILVVAQKIVSKAEGAVIDLRTVQPSAFAQQWSERWTKDARLIEVILQQSRRIVRMDRGVLITETQHGFVAANAGVDQSNTGGDEIATVLPVDPDASASKIRSALGCGAVIISDTFGRPWREGLVNVAIGVAGMEAVEDLRGTTDRSGRLLSATLIARADELAAAGNLVMGKAAGVPVALIEGFAWRRQEGTAQALIRTPDSDLFR